MISSWLTPITGDTTRALGKRVRRRVAGARQVAKLATGPSAKLRVWLVFAAMPIRHRIASLRDSPIAVRLCLGGESVEIWISDSTELSLVETILAREEYGAAPVPEDGTILDLGANVGISAIWLRWRGPRARIIAVEPDPTTFERLLRNVAHDPGVECVHAAITTETGTTGLIPAAESWRSHVGDRDDPDSIEVPSLTLDDLVATRHINHIDLIKFDIEGMEWAVLDQATCLSQTDALVGELHAANCPQDATQFIADLAARHGFVQVDGMAPSHVLLARV